MLRVEETIAENLASVQTAIAAACARAGREASEVCLVAVTKYAADEWVQALAARHHHLGESRPQQLVSRAKLFGDKIDWHLIGQLQRNKVRMVLPACRLIHSVDSWRLLERIQRIADEDDLRPAVLLEVNVSGEPTKSGFDRAELQRSAERLCEFSNVAVSGLMTMAPATRDLDTARKVFSQLRELRNGLATATGLPLQELSMGMSGDFETAIEEGATIVRVGSRLFAGLPYRA